MVDRNITLSGVLMKSLWLPIKMIALVRRAVDNGKCAISYGINE